MIQVVMNKPSAAGKSLQKLIGKIETKNPFKVNWTGAPLPDTLNAAAFTNKFRQALVLSRAGVPTVKVSIFKKGADWLPRRANHQQGYDFTNRRFLRGRIPADFFVKKEDLIDEYRVHVFRTKQDNMRILRIARRVPNRPDYHPWVRSHRLGWKLSYVGGLCEEGKEISRNALRALSLDFGAVDIGLRAESSPIVLEVNTCPGIEGNTLELYAENIIERFS